MSGHLRPVRDLDPALAWACEQYDRLWANVRAGLDQVDQLFADFRDKPPTRERAAFLEGAVAALASVTDGTFKLPPYFGGPAIDAQDDEGGGDVEPPEPAA